MKKILSLCAALALAASLGGPAVAAEVPPWLLGPLGQEAAEAGPEPAAKEPPADTISVVLPTSPWVVVNPYGLRVERDGVASMEQVVSPVESLVNCGAAPVRVEVNAVGVVPPESGVSLAAAPPSGYGRDVFLYVEFQPWPDQWTGWFSDGANQLLVTPWGESKADVLTLEPYGAGYFRLSGATSAPSEAWTAQDTVDVTLSFTFTPVYTTPAVPEPAPEAPVVPDTPEVPEIPPAGAGEPAAPDEPAAPEIPAVPETPGTPPAGTDEVQPVPPEEPAPEEETDVGQDGGEVPEGPDQPEGPTEEDPAAGTEDAVPPES